MGIPQKTNYPHHGKQTKTFLFYIKHSLINKLLLSGTLKTKQASGHNGIYPYSSTFVSIGIYNLLDTPSTCYITTESVDRQRRR